LSAIFNKILYNQVDACIFPVIFLLLRLKINILEKPTILKKDGWFNFFFERCNYMQTLMLNLEKVRHSKIIVYVTSDRQNLPVQIEEDVIEIFHHILESMGDQEKIDLFIYSRGGSTIVPLPLVRLIRKYCNKFSVLVPFRAHSAATMICVGADEVYMTRKAELGPVDPQFNLMINQAQKTYGTTDLFAYLEFAKHEMGWQASNTEISLALLEFFHKYCSLSPDLIGKIYRSYTQSRKYIAELAGYRSAGYALDKDAINQLIFALVSGFGSHDYKIDAYEAKKLGLNILPYDKKLEHMVNELYRAVAVELKLNEPFVPQATGKEVAVMVRSEAKKAAKYAIIKSVTSTPKGNVADLGISSWELS